jgi:DNA-binding transcriptional ArsR family regulator
MLNAKGDLNRETHSTADATPDASAQPATAPDAAVVPAEVLVISDLAVLRVLSDGLRLQLIEAFGRTRGVPRSVKEVAKEIGQSATKLYYHVNLLEENGLLLVAESRLVSGILEKKYVPAARQYTVDKELLRTAEGGLGSEGESVFGQTIDTLLHSAAVDFRRAMVAGLATLGDESQPRRRSVLSKSVLRLRPEDAAKVIELLESLAQTKDDETPDADTYGLTVAFHRRANAEDHRK